jgi:hypothetical protein
MSNSTFTFNIDAALTKRLFPTITLWNRLEGRPRTDKFDRALKAEVRDALWMLTRQWQLGEFNGDDAGSPIFAKAHLTTTKIRKYRADAHSVEPFDDNVPLEAKVERRPIVFTFAGTDMALDLRLLMGRQWLKMIAAVGSLEAQFIAAYPIHSPDPTDQQDAHICAHPEAWSAFTAASGRRMDGAKLYQYVTSDSTHHAYDGILGLTAQQQADIDTLALRFVGWFERLYYQPPASREDAWQPDRLEYQFACSAPVAQGEKILTAEEYYHGRLDWYNLDIDPSVTTLGDPAPPDPALPAGDTQTLLPAPVVFEGMPNTRWWMFEDRRTNFGDVKPDTTDLAKLLLVEFCLIYANDWFLIPYRLPTGSLARVRGLAVTNVFGERTWVEAAGRGLDEDWQRWAMFLLNIKGEGREAADTSLVLLPTVPKVQEGTPLDEVMLIRDEMANMVWGVEKRIPLPSGDSKPGAEAAQESLAFFKQDLERRLDVAPPLAPVEYHAKIHYQVMNSVPENWIPLIPVHVDGDNREIQLQRAALPRTLEGDPDPPRKVHPRTVLLREGLDQAPAVPYFLHEEEVSRAGVRVTQSFQRTRWRDGSVFVWLGVRKRTGRGEGASGLVFDRIVDVKGKR